MEINLEYGLSVINDGITSMSGVRVYSDDYAITNKHHSKLSKKKRKTKIKRRKQKYK